MLCIYRPQYYKLIEECVTQIVLHRSGVDPDFQHTKRFSIDVEPLLGKLVGPEILSIVYIFIKHTCFVSGSNYADIIRFWLVCS